MIIKPIYVVILALIIVLWAIVSTDDYNVELLEQAEYCERVTDGVHTDYKNIYQAACKAN